METCDVCGGELVLLGALGNREWYRCRNCGSEQSVVTTKPGTFSPDDDDNCTEEDDA